MELGWEKMMSWYIVEKAAAKYNIDTINFFLENELRPGSRSRYRPLENYNIQSEFYLFDSHELAKAYANSCTIDVPLERSVHREKVSVFHVEINDDVDLDKRPYTVVDINNHLPENTTSKFHSCRTINKDDIKVLLSFEYQEKIYHTQSNGSYRRALNPLSDRSGIYYSQARYSIFNHTEMRDKKVLEQINEARSNGLIGLFTLFQLLYGDHYDLKIKGHGRKGIVDFLFFPLLARKLITDCYQHKQHSSLINIASFVVAVPLELSRFGLSFALAVTFFIPVMIAQVIGELSQALYYNNSSTFNAPRS